MLVWVDGVRVGGGVPPQLDDSQRQLRPLRHHCHNHQPLPPTFPSCVLSPQTHRSNMSALKKVQTFGNIFSRRKRSGGSDHGDRSSTAKDNRDSTRSSLSIFPSMHSRRRCILAHTWAWKLSQSWVTLRMLNTSTNTTHSPPQTLPDQH